MTSYTRKFFAKALHDKSAAVRTKAADWIWRMRTAETCASSLEDASQR